MQNINVYDKIVYLLKRLLLKKIISWWIQIYESSTAINQFICTK